MLRDMILYFCAVLLLLPLSHALPSFGSELCRYLPGDTYWPTEAEWSKLNTTVGGRLIKTIPLGSPCHGSSYRAAECEYLQAEWTNPELQYAQLHPYCCYSSWSKFDPLRSADSPSSFGAPFFQAQACDPFTNKSSPCELGNYYVYAINVTGAADVAVGLAFAQDHNIRLVIKNTGHEQVSLCVGTLRVRRSSGKGALGLWTHNLRAISILDYKSSLYTGKAMKVGSGVQVFHAYSAAHKAGLRVVGGTCSTIGMAGGYTQGGGHSMLSTAYGLAADQVLEWEAVLADGTHLTATPTENADLYWALSGGGGGTYAVVLSMTIKAYADSPVAGAMLQIKETSSSDNFWESVEAIHAAMPTWIDMGASTAYVLSNGVLSLQMLFTTRSAGEVKSILQPLVEKLDSLSAEYMLNITAFGDYHTAFNNYFGAYPNSQVQGNRLIPRSGLTSNTSIAALTLALREIVSNPSFYILGVGIDVSTGAFVPNAVFPGWRNAIASLEVIANWDYNVSYAENAEHQRLITDVYIPSLTAVTGPESGAYMNEADFQQPDFQSQFFGENYAALRAIKGKYDPQGVFYGNALVGSEEWVVGGDGRLCLV
ncbi:FAD-binding oxidoreductase [Aspergillus mulundensis]|uniref:FAD-binding PCMH-type domain-containing protein n=1 Tax=Aspergillus mulundensis TaxID=1810919 RepID=A0A3D8RK77_9EURO|nr:Uncharacterized protein DSM5745_07114 [Aspergillus mulundensis]RDW74452.1 Uncharacterized protein DSM5745_07114 [Aspergillus mulundensis]